MNTFTDFIFPGPRAFFEGEGAGSGGGANPTPSGDTPATPASGTPSAVGAPAEAAPATPAATETPPADGEQNPAAPAEGQGDGETSPAESGEGQQGQNTETAPVDFKVEVPQGMETFKEEFETYGTDAAKWLSENPNASAAEALQWVATRQGELTQQQQAQAAETFVQERNANVEKWDSILSADKNFGGDNLDASKGLALKALESHPDGKDLHEMLEHSGYGSHPLVFFGLAAYAKHYLSEAPVVTSPGGGARKSLSEALYGGNK